MNLKVFIALLLVGVLGGSGAGYLVLQQRGTTPPVIAQTETQEPKQEEPGTPGGVPTNGALKDAEKLFRVGDTIENLKVGDCLSGSWGQPLKDAVKVACTDQHISEVISIYSIVDPGAKGETLKDKMNAMCNTDVTNYLAKVSKDAKLNLTSAADVPDAPTAFACLLGEMDGSKRSLKGVSL
jgi:hypothetical protein